MSAPAGAPDGALAGASAVAGLARAWRGLVWYLRAVTGEDRWHAHVRDCAAHGHPPGSRREFERARAQVTGARPVSRCC